MNKCPVTGKQRHRSAGAAKAHRRALLKAERSSEPGLLAIYHCQHCEGWHVGHSEMRRPVTVMPVQPKMKRSAGLRYKRTN